MKRMLRWASFLGIAMLVFAACTMPAPTGGAATTSGPSATAEPTEEEMTGATEMTGTSEMTSTSEMTGATEMTGTSEMTGATEMSGTAAMSGVSLAIYDSPTLGQILTDEQGMVLYVFDKDEPGMSNCADTCARNWPPLTVADEDVTMMGDDVTGTLATIERDDGTYQVTINGWPLYYYAKDQNPHDTVGQAVGDVWWVVAPDGSKVTTQ